MPTTKEWIIIVSVVALVMIPICWRFWKGWDRPSLASIREMKRRITERDTREAFIREEAKVREHERLEAAQELARKKAQAPLPVEKERLFSAFGSLGAIDSTNTEVLENSPQEVVKKISIPVSNVDSLVDSLDIEDIDDTVIPEASPVAIQLRGNAESRATKESDDDDEWSEVDW
tara:strand:- start:789 stop:1313 length:525 start_codon:yes stop_codon:yes gene_type:complete